MRVTDEMVDVGCDAMLAFYKSGADWTQHPHHAARAVLDAVLADVPEPDAIVKACDMACRGVEADLATERTRVAKLESRLSDVCALLRNTKGAYVEKAWLAFVLGDEP